MHWFVPKGISGTCSAYETKMGGHVRRARSAKGRAVILLNVGSNVRDRVLTQHSYFNNKDAFVVVIRL